MSWRDFFYFSKGERSALIVLLCQITVAGILFMLSDSPDSKPAEEVSATIIHPDSVEANPVSELPAASVSAAAPEQAGKVNRPKESVSERVKRLTSPRTSFGRTKKLSAGSVIELNSADTTLLKKVPGIGTSFANRIVKYRNLLGGFYSVAQLGEVYGIDEDKYSKLAPWFTADTSLIKMLPVNSLSRDSLRRHPYINSLQAKAIDQLRKQKKHLSGWENLQLLNEFTEQDKIHLRPYLSFE
jgi:DNA uptake protein ComE-like DNA-binding protein